MRRAHTVTFKTEYKGQIIEAHSIDGGALRFRCDLLKEMHKSRAGGDPYEVTKTYDNVESILEAIDRYELSLRKDFTNKIAYRIGGGWRQDKHTITEVEVTSITEDGTEAWIKVPKEKHAYGSGREKVGITSLYASKEACQRYVDAMNAAVKEYERTINKLDTELKKDTNLWKPLTTKN